MKTAKTEVGKILDQNPQESLLHGTGKELRMEA